MASTTEAWGISIIEGLGWGLPVLSSRQCGAGLTLALEMGDAVKLCGTSAEEIASSLQEFVVDLARHSHAAKAVAPRIRRKYGMAEVADALAELASGIRG
jgi:glycosyltransferase involved in cell wall biosynthesis